MIKLSANAEQRLFYVVNLLAASYPALLLSTGKAYSYAPFALLLIAIPMLFQLKKESCVPDVRQIIAAFSVFFLIVPLSLLLKGGELSEADMPSRIVMALPIFLLLLRYPPKAEWILNSCAIGAIIAGFVAIFHTQILGTPRAFVSQYDLASNYMPIQSGNMAMSLASFSLIGLFHSLKNRQHLRGSLFAVAITMGILGSFLSGSRGGWILTPLIMLFIGYYYKSLLSKKVIAASLIAISLLSVASYPQIEPRVNQAIEQLTQYSDHGQANTSVGARFEMWKSAWYSFREHPLFGTGFPGRVEAQAKQVELQLVDPIVQHYGRAHNQYLEALSTKGILGLTALLAIFVLPLKQFYRRLSIKSQQQSLMALCGITHVLQVMGYCLTQNYLNHNSGIIFYSFLTVVFLAVTLNTRPEPTPA